MALESVTRIVDLVATNPTGGDPKSQGDDHLRLLKTVLQTEFNPYTHGSIGSMSLPGGLIVKWGGVRNSASADVTVTFATPFPSVCYGILITPAALGNGAYGNYNTAGPTGFNFSTWTSVNTRATDTDNFWIAVGK